MSIIRDNDEERAFRVDEIVRQLQRRRALDVALSVVPNKSARMISLKDHVRAIRRARMQVRGQRQKGRTD